MAYMRGDYYLWTDSEDLLHIWVADGADGWEDTIWHFADDGETQRVEPSHMRDGENIASGVSIPQPLWTNI